jgi:hypothetical protein
MYVICECKKNTTQNNTQQHEAHNMKALKYSTLIPKVATQL